MTEADAEAIRLLAHCCRAQAPDRMRHRAADSPDVAMRCAGFLFRSQSAKRCSGRRQRATEWRCKRCPKGLLWCNPWVEAANGE